MRFKLIPLEQIQDPDAPARLHPEDAEIEDLAASIAEIGLINPLTVKPVGDHFEVIAGHRRLMACRFINYSPVPCMVREGEDDKTYETMLAENVARKDLSPIEEAAILREMQERLNYGVGTLSKVVGKSPAWVQQRLQLLHLPPDLQEDIHERGLPIETAKALAEVDDVDVRRRWAREAIVNRVGFRSVKLWVQSYQQQKAIEEVTEETIRDIEQQREPTVPKGSCWVCKDRYPYEQLKSVLLCRNCYRELLRALLSAEIDGEPREPTDNDSNRYALQGPAEAVPAGGGNNNPS